MTQSRLAVVNNPQRQGILETVFKMKLTGEGNTTNKQHSQQTTTTTMPDQEQS